MYGMFICAVTGGYFISCIEEHINLSLYSSILVCSHFNCLFDSIQNAFTARSRLYLYGIIELV
jgi:hypothetical protein